MTFRKVVVAILTAASLLAAGALWYAASPDSAGSVLGLVVQITVVGLSIVLPGTLIGIAGFQIVRRFVPRESGKRATWVVVSAILSGIMSVVVYLVLLYVATLPHDSDGTAYVLMFWIPLTSPIVAVLGVTFGAGWGQRKD